MRHQALLKTTGQQGPAVLVSHKGEVLTGHTDPRTPGPFQTTNKVPPFFHSSFVRQFISSTPGPRTGTREEKMKNRCSNNRSETRTPPKRPRHLFLGVPITVFCCYSFANTPFWNNDRQKHRLRPLQHEPSNDRRSSGIA